MMDMTLDLYLRNFMQVMLLPPDWLIAWVSLIR